MANDDGDTTERAGALETALASALGPISGRGDAPAGNAEGYRWLGIGIRLGLERPDAARRLLDLLEARGGDAAGAAPTATSDPGAGPTGAVPVLSLLLARSAALPPSERSALGPDVVFGWASELTSGQVLGIGRVVMEMLAAGAPVDAARGFGLAWDGGAKIPRHERDTMFSEFTDLELTVASLLAGRDLRAVAPAPKPRFGALADMFGTRNAGQSAAAAALEGAGEPGRRGLVALWNAWMALRYRSLLPGATFELLARPWVTIVGPLPER